MGQSFLVTASGEAAKGFSFLQMHGNETLGRLFEFDVELLSEDLSIDLSAVVGKSLTLQMELSPDAVRFFNGLVTEIKLLGSMGRYTHYQATVQPAFWLLTLTSNSRIFQRKTVPNIVKQICKDRGLSNIDDRLSGTYRTWEYLVQYRETDWNFVSRILELEGIYFYFTHDKGGHTLVLSDSIGSHEAFPGYKKIHFAREEADLAEHIASWTASRRLVSGAYAAKDFNFQVPRSPLLSHLSTPTGNAHDELEIFNYPGGFLTSSEGDDQVHVRLEEHQAGVEVFAGAGVVRGLASGFVFTLADHPRDDQNAEYLVVSSSIDVSVSGYESGVIDTKYRCSFEALPSTRQFRPAETTPKPRVEGPQTAIVVGPAKEEIWTDKYGRVKVQFHWDREGKNDENSSCWVRVSQAWAGSNWGAIHIPRIGQEVIVDFLEGDPDRPLIIGRVYNDANMPPYDLPKKPTQSGIKSRSTKGGLVENANEIRFEDLKGEEELFIQAEKNQTTVVKANQSISVGGDRSLSVTGKSTRTVVKKDSVTLKDEHEITVFKKVTETYQDDQNIDVAKNKTEHVAQTYDLTTDQQFKLTQGGTTLTFQSNQVTLDAASSITVTRGPAKLTIDDSGQVSLSTPTGISFECGPNKITMSPSGIEISGPQVAVKAGPSSLELGPASGKLSAPMTTIEATTICSIKGTVMVNLNSG